MSTKRKKPNPLKGDPRRQAVAALRGYEYQIWHTVHDWLDLKGDALMFVEGAEDFDVVSPTRATVSQIKDTKAKITLRTPAVIEAICHFWQLQTDHPETHVLFRFVTRSDIGVEQGNPFGIGVAGLSLWKACTIESAAVTTLSSFLISDSKLSPNLMGFLKAAKPEDVFGKLIAPLVWETNSQEVKIVEEAVRRKLILHGESRVPPIPPSEASKVISRLLKEVFAIATKQNNRCLDYARFLEVFEEETTERMPRQEIAKLRNLAAASTFSISSFGLSESTSTFQASSPVETNIPPTPADIAPRSKVVNQMVASLQQLGVLVLVGSTGTGKTTLAKLTAAQCKGAWRWISFSTVVSQQYAHAFRSLAVLLEQAPEANCILLDDVNLLPEHSRQLEDYLAGILYTILQRKGRLIITSQKTLPQRLSHHLGLHEKSTEVVPAMTHREITDFAIQLGCQSEENAGAWAAITLIHTSGHVQLVHAHMKNLVRQGWPTPSTDDALKQPTHVGTALSEARMLLQSLPDSHRQLLYRLSIVAGSFRRDHAIAIGELNPAVPFVGDACDQLVGPWIEHVDHEYMRVSPLLKNCGAQVWSAEAMKGWHEIIGFAILRCSPRTAWEASTVLMHGVSSRSGRLILAIVSSVLGGSEELIKAIAPTLFWLKFFIKAGTPIFPESRSVNFMLRLLQFRVAAELEPETSAVEVLGAWESDALPDSPPEFVKCSRILYLGILIHRIKVPVAPRKLIRAIVEMANLMEDFPPLKEAFDKAREAKNETGQRGTSDSIGVALLVTLGRPTSVRFLEELLDALEEDAPTAVRERILAGLRTNEALVRVFLDAAWVDESKLPLPNWPNCIRVFEKCITLGQRWKVHELVYCAARAVAIVRDEYLDDERGALAILELHAPREGSPSITIENERATVLLRRNHNEDALASWDRILPIWQNPPTSGDTAVLFALNKAGKAAARAGKWKRAVALFTDGASRAALLTQHVQAAAFRTDAAWALWRAGEHHASYHLLCETFDAVEALPAPQTTPHVAKVQKSFGHILVCIRREIEQENYGELGEPPPGLASDPDASDKWQAPAMLWCLVFLAEIECYFRLEPIVFLQARARTVMSRSPSLGALIAELEVRYAFRTLEFDVLPKMCRVLEASALASKAQREKGMTGFEEMDSPLLNFGPNEQSQSIMTVLLTQALAASLAGGGVPTELIEHWRDCARELSEYTWMNDWLDLAKKVFSVPTPEALEIMQNNSLPGDTRLMAAVRLMGDWDAGVDRMFNAQLWIASWLGQSKMFWYYEAANYFASHLARMWKKQCAFGATLRNPRLTIPEIERECDSKAEGIVKAAKILLAAANTVTIQMSDELRRQLQTLASTASVNPYRFAIQP